MHKNFVVAEIGTKLANDCLAKAEQQLSAMRIHQAITLYDQAEVAGCDPDVAAAGRWTCYMLLGDFERAWCEGDHINRRGKPDANRFWNGKPLNGNRVLIRCLHGLGDTIQFIRYAPLLRGITKSVIIEAQPKLKELLRQSQLADDVITWKDTEPPWDQQVEVMELPRIFRTTLGTIPSDVPYISVSDAQPSNPDSLNVGIVWNSSAFNPARSIPLAELAPIFDIPRLNFFSLQCGSEDEELAHWVPRISDIHDQVNTLEDTARVIRTLQLVITVDTMTAHLAGAMAVPVWTLLPYECDWRWMIDREDSPWYPTMRLFRQPQQGDWNAVVRSLTSELKQLATRANEQNGSFIHHCPPPER